MASNLTIPDDRRRVDQLAFNEPMRITWQNDPAVAMKLGTPDHHVLMIIGKDGVVRSMKPNQYAGTVSFIDYLLETESVTIFGSQTERSDETDLKPMPVFSPDRPHLEIGCWRGDVPDFIPYKMKNETAFFHAINVPSTKFGRIALSFESNRDFTKFSRTWMPYGSLSKRTSGKFMGYSDHPIDEWHTHVLLKSYGVEDPASWPRN